MNIPKKLLLFCLGGGVYNGLELLWRGWTHWSMFFLGGGCFLALGRLASVQMSKWLRPILGSLTITTGELAVGLLVNRRHTVWDYRGCPPHFLGQICLRYSLLWMPLSLATMSLYRRLCR